MDDDSKTYYYVRYHANKVKFKPFDGYASDDEMRPYEFKNSWLNQIPNFAEKNTLWGVRSNQLSKIKAKKNWVYLDDIYEDLVFEDKKVERYVQYYEQGLPDRSERGKEHDENDQQDNDHQYR